MSRFQTLGAILFVSALQAYPTTASSQVAIGQSIQDRLSIGGDAAVTIPEGQWRVAHVQFLDPDEAALSAVVLRNDAPDALVPVLVVRYALRGAERGYPCATRDSRPFVLDRHRTLESALVASCTRFFHVEGPGDLVDPAVPGSADAWRDIVRRIESFGVDWGSGGLVLTESTVQRVGGMYLKFEAFIRTSRLGVPASTMRDAALVGRESPAQATLEAWNRLIVASLQRDVHGENTQRLSSLDAKAQDLLMLDETIRHAAQDSKHEWGVPNPWATQQSNAELGSAPGTAERVEASDRSRPGVSIARAANSRPAVSQVLSLADSLPWRWPFADDVAFLDTRASHRARARISSQGAVVFNQGASGAGLSIISTQGAVISAPTSGKVVYQRRMGELPLLVLEHGEGVFTMVYGDVDFSVPVGSAVVAGESIGSVLPARYDNTSVVSLEIVVHEPAFAVGTDPGEAPARLLARLRTGRHLDASSIFGRGIVSVQTAGSEFPGDRIALELDGVAIGEISPDGGELALVLAPRRHRLSAKSGSFLRSRKIDFTVTLGAGEVRRYRLVGMAKSDLIVVESDYRELYAETIRALRAGSRPESLGERPAAERAATERAAAERVAAERVAADAERHRVERELQELAAQRQREQQRPQQSVASVAPGPSPGLAGTDDQIAAPAATKPRKFALVIGNAAYPTMPLKNPLNDARAVSRKLASYGFEVTTRENLKVRDIGRILAEFGSRIAPGSSVVFFYAGHGVQLKGENFLPAVDADVRTEYDVPTQSLSVNRVLDMFSDRKAALTLVLLDACRNNPFGRAFRSTGTGLAPVNAPSGTLLSYATRPGSVAVDGDGEHGLYTRYLLMHMDAPDLPVELVFKRVASDVRRASNGSQEPWSEGHIDGEFAFNSTGTRQGAR